MKRVIFTNQKGGVGKTTIARELGITLASRGHRMLLVDSDPQGNLSKSLLDGSQAESEMQAGLYEALEGEAPNLIQVRPNLSLLSGDARLAGLEKRYLGEVDAYERLRSILDALEQDEKYELVLIDSPPSLGVMTLNGLAAASHIIIPVRPALYSLQGTNDLLASVAKVKRSLNPDLELLGVIVNEFNSQPVITRQIHGEIVEVFGNRVFQTVLSRTVKIEEAIALRLGVIEVDNANSDTKIVREIIDLSDEFTSRLGLAPGGYS